MSEIRDLTDMFPEGRREVSNDPEAMDRGFTHCQKCGADLCGTGLQDDGLCGICMCIDEPWEDLGRVKIRSTRSHRVTFEAYIAWTERRAEGRQLRFRVTNEVENIDLRCMTFQY